MTTATRTKTNVLGELVAREDRWQAARDEASRLGTEYGVRSQRFEALQDERRRLIHRNPELVDHTGAPAGNKNPVAEIDKQIENLGDLPDLHNQVVHARRLEQSAQQATHDYIAAHFDAILVTMEPEADAVVAEVVRAMGVLADAAGAYLALTQRVQALNGTVHGRQHMRAVALDTASDLVRLSRDYVAPPRPTEIR